MITGMVGMALRGANAIPRGNNFLLGSVLVVLVTGVDPLRSFFPALHPGDPLSNDAEP
ncbi:hypothetical protein SH467x_004142 [Pirellulaceae bacterium SH467]